MRSTGIRIRTLAALALAAGCQADRPDDALPIGLLLSYSGDLAASSINSERAFLMAVQAANLAGGVAGRPITVLARDTGSDPAKVTQPALELVAAQAAVIVGPDMPDLAVALRIGFSQRTLILPSFTTSSNDHKPHGWFVMGAGPSTVACELFAQVAGSGAKKPLLLSGTNAYDSDLAFALTGQYGVPEIFLPGEVPSNNKTVQPILDFQADAYILTTAPPAASSLFYTLAALDQLGDPNRWFLSPSLHTPALLENVPRGLLEGARGVSAVQTDISGGFQDSFNRRWQDRPLDNAYPFYDAGAVAVLALQRAVSRTGLLPEGSGLGPHIVAVTNPGGVQVGWDQIGTGLQHLRAGQEVEYIGLTGPLRYDSSGRTTSASTHWWTIRGHTFEPIPRPASCAP